MLSTDDLLLIAALARSGKPAPAAAGLNVHLATVYRRLKELEQEAGAPLFQRLGGQYVPTPLGSELVRAAMDVEANLAEARRQLAGGEQRLAGRITLTTPDSLVPLVSTLLPPVRRKHAGIRFDLVVSNTFADMARYEAEVAIRPTRSPPETLVGQRAGAFRYAIYVKSGTREDLPWIALDDSLSAIPAARWLTAHVAEEEIVLRVNSMWAAAQAAAAGLGRALLPDYLHRSFDLDRQGDFIGALESEVWLLIHPDLRRTPRIQAFMDLAAGKLRAQLKA
ncbi:MULTISPECIES: LysR family transcriptional regulator [unclassified Shinella]|uniref:LysR family transcriptional regulator n=1 Tax=unclassified Shinella TaxID=2643062 RepID=UPI00225D0257|nr:MULTISPECIES: LysR family transcriptional regulator [unclassified Shinella]MCO5139754.1 LysR family transcriptional regulator [Shinella sp.]MDC7258609.1 LysR family transcriptional regulator [Shinella sp. YE25]CAI0334953.1 LysR family transcriptional regulator [Rhizobiaceae bacterium]CAK7260373.1 LysR family transcriptional regulator [Shinella sp. WSC3-e]